MTAIHLTAAAVIPDQYCTPLENGRVGLQHFISHHETLLSSIHRIPIEVLTLIFLESCKDDDVLHTNISVIPSLHRQSVELYSTGVWYQELEAFCWAPCPRKTTLGIHLWHLVLKDFIGRPRLIPEFLNRLTELEHLITLEIMNVILGAVEIKGDPSDWRYIIPRTDNVRKWIQSIPSSGSSDGPRPLRNVFMVDINVLLLMELAPGIQSLVVHEAEDASFSTITDRLLRRLTIKSDSHNTKPILLQLRDIVFLFDEEVSENILARMIDSRCTRMMYGGESSLLASAALGIRTGREVRKETVE
ncbi:hypothetical protein IW261DRAFT_1655193 [Armillaria novae-zelandiae]|uniref:Uncharacterized protein n=1 Tax=Armillaria novae-zelandiae TaxID=153914 RepID=A0AA39PPF1_9AGAR|nr:hypothetical protein IW261DRAFT_1655193 [Armillaria novae-zelandiae]